MESIISDESLHSGKDRARYARPCRFFCREDAPKNRRPRGHWNFKKYGSSPNWYWPASSAMESYSLGVFRLPSLSRMAIFSCAPSLALFRLNSSIFRYPPPKESILTTHSKSGHRSLSISAHLACRFVGFRPRFLRNRQFPERRNANRVRLWAI